MQGNAAPLIDEERIFAITRPHFNLLIQYFCWSLASFVLFPVVFVPLFFKYHTLRYRFDSEGISMSWGLLFRREINLTYARIQDIHLSRGIIERWLGIATLSVQTASGSSEAEVAIQGLLEYEELRDFLYSRMRGRRLRSPAPAQSPATAGLATAGAAADEGSGEALELLREIHDDLAALRQALSPSRPAPENGGERRA
ncbi:MAG TPA: PH domain-containing protein [Sumerlaeia bacterium]|nr:PH domain-containing protein [Sumerlaeia bacterium]